MMTCILTSGPFCRPVLKFLSVFGVVFTFLITIIASPILLFFYCIFLLRAKITQIIYSTRQMQFLSGSDAFYGQDNTTTNSIINVLCLMESHLKIQVLRDVILNRIVLHKNEKGQLMFPKFSQYVTLQGDYLLWCNEEKFNINNHVTEYKGRFPKTEDDLTKIITKLCNKRLPLHKSGWQIILIPSEGNYDLPIKNKFFIKIPQTCMLCRVHHSIADGLSLTRLILEHLTENSNDLKSTLQQMVAKLMPHSKNRCTAKLKNFANCAYAFVYAPFIQLNQAFAKDKNMMHGPKLTGKKRYGWTPVISLQTIKDIKNATATTVNDVILSCLAGALRRYFLAHNAEVPSFLHGAIPVNLQGPEDPLHMKNAISFVLAHLPTGETDPIRRLQTTKYIMNELKSSPDVIVNLWLLKYCVNVVPNSLIKWFVNRSPVSIIFSNVPGPIRKITFQNHKITSILPFLPHRGTTGLAICIFSYAGNFRVTISVDSALISKTKEIRELLNGFLEELAALQLAIQP